jgi:tRNA-Thr(GGU) m(6)t(6)A37 methyltransferase TsaA
LPFQAGLKDLAGFERIWLIYWFHMAAGQSLLVTPFLDTHERGVFATRAPARPSPIGISTVRLLSVQDGGVLEVADVDILDGTPLLDIKPYVPEFDCYPHSKAGWFDESNSQRQVADERFER